MFFFKKHKKTIKDLEEKVDILESSVKECLSSLEKSKMSVESLFKSLDEDVGELTQAMNELKEKSDKIDEILEDYENFSIEKTLAKKSNEPWAGLSVSEVDPSSGRVGIKVDWNDKFQEHLRRSGIPGNNDDERMSIWLTSLIKEWGEEIDEETAKTYREDL